MLNILAFRIRNLWPSHVVESSVCGSDALTCHSHPMPSADKQDDGKVWRYLGLSRRSVGVARGCGWTQRRLTGSKLCRGDALGDFGGNIFLTADSAMNAIQSSFVAITSLGPGGKLIR